MLVALLEQQPAPRVDQGDAREAHHARLLIAQDTWDGSRVRRLLIAAAGAALPLALLAPAAPAAVAGPAAADELVVTGFVLGSSHVRVLEESAGALGQVDVVGTILRPDGRRVSTPGADARRLLGRSHRLGLRAELLLSNYSNRLEDFDPRAAHRLLSRRDRLDRVVARLASLVARQGWDGVNVDLERVRAADAAGLVALVEGLQAAMPAAKTVSIDVSASTTRAGYRRRGYRLAALGRAADVVALMTYDYSGPAWSRPGPIGPLGWQRRAVRTALLEVPRERLDLGVAGYGYTWPRPSTGRTGRSIAPRAARRLVRRDGANAVWRTAYGEWTARLSDGTTLWWSDARSYRRRVRLARDLGLHGLAVWRLGSADPL